MILGLQKEKEMKGGRYLSSWWLICTLKPKRVWPEARNKVAIEITCNQMALGMVTSGQISPFCQVRILKRGPWCPLMAQRPTPHLFLPSFSHQTYPSLRRLEK